VVKKNLKNLYPSDWKEFKFGKLFDFEGGLSISRANLSNEGICYLHYGDIHKSADNYIDIEKSYTLIPKYNESINNINTKFLLNDGDIVFADASEDYEGIGKSVVVINPNNIPFISGLHTIVAKDKSNLLNNGYKRFFLLDWNIRKQIMLIATGISVYGISKNNIKNVKVYLPPIEEQKKISSILSTWDKAIELKERLIELKKEQKKGLMQKLLTGQVRLPGFEGEWKQVKLGDLVEKVIDNRGKTPPVTNTGYELIEVNAFEGNGRHPDYSKIKKYVTEETYKNWFRNGHPVKNDILVATVGSVGSSVIMKDNRGCIAQNIVALRIKTEYSAEFIYYWMRSYSYFRLIEKVLMGAVQPSLKVPHLLQFKLKLPDISEQCELAKIFTILDNSLMLLEKEVNELKLQKKGLMQLLLTGKVRVQV
jgi:type I restriction enzyme, S subunit